MIVLRHLPDVMCQCWIAPDAFATSSTFSRALSCGCCCVCRGFAAAVASSWAAPASAAPSRAKHKSLRHVAWRGVRDERAFETAVTHDRRRRRSRGEGVEGPPRGGEGAVSSRGDGSRGIESSSSAAAARMMSLSRRDITLVRPASVPTPFGRKRMHVAGSADSAPGCRLRVDARAADRGGVETRIHAVASRRRETIRAVNNNNVN